MTRAQSHSRVPVNLISGPLGVGKTTTINHLLRQRPADQRWAVLVNEYGLVGLDGAFMEGGPGQAAGDAAPGVEIQEVAGGCICCSAAMMFEVSLVRLLRRRPDRLLIEPTGLAAVSGILETLGRAGIREAVEVRSVMCMLDPARLEQSLGREEVRDQIDAADILLGGRCDLADAAQLRHFDAWASDLYPPKRWVERVDRGKISASLLDLVGDRATRHTMSPSRTPHHLAHEHEHHDHEHEHHDHDHHGDGVSLNLEEGRTITRRVHPSELASTMGWICHAELVFDADRALSWLRALAGIPGARRTKAVLHTTRGWQLYNLADRAEEVRPSGYRRDSRIEVVVEEVPLPDVEAVEQDLRACLSR